MMGGDGGCGGRGGMRREELGTEKDSQTGGGNSVVRRAYKGEGGLSAAWLAGRGRRMLKFCSYHTKASFNMTFICVLQSPTPPYKEALAADEVSQP